MKLWWNFDEGIIDEQLNKLLLSRKAYIGTLSKRINKITSLLNNLNSKEALETENSKLGYTVNEVQKITSKYCNMQRHIFRLLSHIKNRLNLNHLEPKFKFQQNKLNEINKTLEISKLERKINKTKIRLEQKAWKRLEVASIRKGANLYLKSNPILDRKSVPTPKTVKTPGENQNLNICKSSTLNTQDVAT